MPRSRRPLLIALGLVSMLLCGWKAALVIDTYTGYYDEEPIEPGLLPLDPGLVWTEEALAVDFSGNGRGQLLPGGGWYQSRPLGRWWRWPHLHAVGRSVDLQWSEPPAGPLALELRLEPLSGLDGPQAMRVALNGLDLADLELAAGRQTVRIALPQAAWVPGINHTRLTFARVASPAALGLWADGRPTAGRVEWARLVRGEGSVGPSSGLDEARGLLVLRDGSPIRVPLPTGMRSVALDLEGDPPRGAALTVQLVHRTRRTRLAEGPLGQIARKPIEVPRLGRPTELELVASLPDGSKVGLAVRVERGPPPRRDPRPDIVLITVDTLRADALSLYGSTRPTSPHLDALAAEAITFDRAWSTAAWTLPATMSIHTGLEPNHHHFTVSGARPDGEPPLTLAERLAGAGYDTLGISQNPVAGRVHGFDRGFAAFYDTGTLPRGGTESANAAWYLWHHLRTRSDAQRPLFVSIHVVDPHERYAPQAGDRVFAREHLGLLRPWQYEPGYFQERSFGRNPREVAHLRGLYDGEVRRFDRQLGRLRALLEYLGRFDDTLLVVTSDHGEEFGEHGTFGHTRTLYESLLHVPLVIRLPKGELGGRRVDQRVSVVDLVPTILRVAGEAVPEGLDGRSLLPLEELPADRSILAETRPWWKADDPASPFLRAVVAGDLKCIASASGREGFDAEVPPLRAFDLGADPAELAPLELDPAHAQLCEKWLAAGWPDVAARPPSSTALDEEERAALRALGYL